MAEKTTAPTKATETPTPPVEAPSAAAPGQGDLPAEAAPSSAPASSPVPEVAAADTKPEPSLLSEADTGKREGAPEKPAETPPVEAKPPPKPDEGKPKEAAPEDGKVEAKPPEAAKPEAAAETPPAPLPTYEAYKVPEGTKIDDNRLKEFNTILGEYENSPKDHAKTQELGQRMLDLYHSEMSRVAGQVESYQRDVWNRLNEKRINELKSDPDVGGTRLDQKLGNAKYVLETLMGLSPNQQAKLLRKLDTGGVSNDVTFIRGMANLYERFREPNPVIPNQPSTPREPGNRGWYDRIDGQVA
jgi:hypothetical protein